MNRRWGRSFPTAVLVLSIAVAGFGALEAYRNQRSHATTARTLLEDYSEFAAWSFQRSSWELLRGAITNHLQMAYNNPVFARGLATEECLAGVLTPQEPTETCGCPPLLAGGFAFYTRVGESVAESRWAGAPPDAATQQAIIAQTQGRARDLYEKDWPFSVLYIGSDAKASMIAFTLIESPILRMEGFEARRDTVLYGFEIDRDRLAKLYAQVLSDEVLLPPTLTLDRKNSEVITVQVYGPDESLLYSSAPKTEMAFAAPVERQAMFGGGEIRASVLPEVAGELIIGGLPNDRTGVLVLVLSLAGALALLAIVQIRREGQLALFRQDFVASVSHELRTPLAQVRLFTDTLRLGRTKTAEQRHWALENIDRETLRLSNLVENILHFSRAERGVRPAGREPADLGAGVRDAIASFEPLLPERKGTLHTDIPEGLVAEIHVDSIRQVVLNLLDNAVRYGPVGQTIRITGSRMKDSLRICVDDEGPGVPVAERERIFELFRRGVESVGTVVVGSGIGLSVVHEIVTAHQGRVWVEDAPGGGARFIFELPALHTARSDHFQEPESNRGPAAGVA